MISLLKAPRGPETVETVPELLAHHCACAGFAEQAIAYWHKAGRRAIARSAMAEAATQLTKAVELLAGLPDGVGRDLSELEIQRRTGRSAHRHEGLRGARGWPRLRSARANSAGTGAKARRCFLCCLACTNIAPMPLDPMPAERSQRTCYDWPSSTTTMRVAQLDTACTGPAYFFAGCWPRPGCSSIARSRCTSWLIETLQYSCLSPKPVVACGSFISLILQWQGYPDEALRRASSGTRRSSRPEPHLYFEPGFIFELLASSDSR